ncbi:MAG TPA: hypothetical protein VFZ48_02475 [Candidatus Saccharimonadales bacterium]
MDITISTQARFSVAETSRTAHFCSSFEQVEEVLAVVLEQPTVLRVGLHEHGFSIYSSTSLPALPSLDRRAGKPGEPYLLTMEESLKVGLPRHTDAFVQVMGYLQDWCREHPSSCFPDTRRALSA